MPEKAKKEGATIIDVFQADPHGPLAGRVSYGDTPSQVYVNQPQLALLTPLSQIWEDALDEIVTLRMHVSERAAYENANLFPLGYHCYAFLRNETASEFISLGSCFEKTRPRELKRCESRVSHVNITAKWEAEQRIVSKRSRNNRAIAGSHSIQTAATHAFEELPELLQ